MHTGSGNGHWIDPACKKSGSGGGEESAASSIAANHPVETGPDRTGPNRTSDGGQAIQIVIKNNASAPGNQGPRATGPQTSAPRQRETSGQTTLGAGSGSAAITDD